MSWFGKKLDKRSHSWPGPALQADTRELVSVAQLLEDTVRSLHHGARLLFRMPGWTAVAAVSLALGIGVNTVLFSVLNALLFQTLPVRNPDRLVAIRTGSSNCSYPNYVDFRNQNSVFSDVVAYRRMNGLTLALGERKEDVDAELVSENYFSGLGVRILVGRPFADAADQSSGIVISQQLWEELFNSDQSGLGSTLLLNGRQVIVSAVVSEDFKGSSPVRTTDIWVPLSRVTQLRATAEQFGDRRFQWLQLIGRLKDGVSMEQAQADVTLVSDRLEKAHLDENRGFGTAAIYAVNGMYSLIGESFSNKLFLFLQFLFATTVLVLMIACANIANLLTLRAMDRQKEISTRFALGATRRRLIWQLFVEIIPLAIVGGAGAVFLSLWTSSAFALLRLPIPLTLDIQLDRSVLGFASLLTVVTAIVFGIVPALRASRNDVFVALRESTAAAKPVSTGFAFRKLMVVLQVALSLVLLVSAGLFSRSLQNAYAVDVGFDTQHILLVTPRLDRNQYNDNQAQSFNESLSERFAGLPGVTSVSMARIIPLSLNATTLPVVINESLPPDEGTMLVDVNAVGPRYLVTLGIPLLQGREFSTEDQVGAPKVAVVNETMAKRSWPGRNAVGQRFRLGLSNDAPAITVVGLAANSKYKTLGEGETPFIYLPNSQHFDRYMTVHIRTRDDAGQLVALARQEIEHLANGVQVNIETMNDLLDFAAAPARVSAILLSGLSILGLVLAGIGVYGVLAYSVNCRTREIGIRVALGAQHSKILALVLKEGFVLVVFGILLGVGVSLAIMQIVSSLLIDVGVGDPITYIATSLFVALVGFLGNYIPARRATRVNPLDALRCD